MSEFRTNLSKNEKIALQENGLEGRGEHFVMNSNEADKNYIKENKDKFNKAVDEYVNKFQKHNEVLEQYAEDLANDLNGVEIMPMGSYVLAKPFTHNPFQRMVTENGVITDLGGITPEYKSQETGEIEEEDQYMRVATVIETGPKCTFIQPGDIIIYTIASEASIPFYKMGFVVVDEHRIMAVINEKLTERKSKDGNI